MVDLDVFLGLGMAVWSVDVGKKLHNRLTDMAGICNMYIWHGAV